MSSKGKLKKYETEFKDKRIDVKRFAYDVIVYIALKFKVPKNCICIWEGSENEYGCSNFLLVMSRLILRHEISLRYILHMYFNDRFESNKLESFESVGYLLQDSIKQVTRYYTYTLIDELEVSLSIVCELVQFLYSKNLNLYVKKLAEYWFGCYFCLVKKRFEKEGGINHMYVKGNKTRHELLDDFYKHFIQVYCQSYEDSAKNEDLGEIYYKSCDIFKKKFVAALSSEERQKLGEEIRNSPSISYIARLEVQFDVSVSSSIFKLYDCSASDIPENPGLGILPHEELLKSIHGTSPGATLPQNPPSESRKESAKHCRGLSRRQKGKSRLCSSIEQDHGQLSLDSSKAKQLRKPDVLVTDCSKPSVISPTSKRDEVSAIDQIENTGLGICPHEELLKSIHDTGPGEKLSQNLPVKSPQESAKHGRRLHRRQKSNPRLS